jgi:hypothetical protein
VVKRRQSDTKTFTRRSHARPPRRARTAPPHACPRPRRALLTLVFAPSQHVTHPQSPRPETSSDPHWCQGTPRLVAVKAPLFPAYKTAAVGFSSCARRRRRVGIRRRCIMPRSVSRVSSAPTPCRCSAVAAPRHTPCYPGRELAGGELQVDAARRCRGAPAPAASKGQTTTQTEPLWSIDPPPVLSRPRTPMSSPDSGEPHRCPRPGTTLQRGISSRGLNYKIVTELG